MTATTRRAKKATKDKGAVPLSSSPRAADQRRKIIEAAAVEFSRKGYAETTLGDIAKRVGVHTAALYYYFENKEAVVQALMQVAATRITDEVQSVLQEHKGSSALERLQHSIRAYLAVSAQRDYVARAFWKIHDQVAPEILNNSLAEDESIFYVWRQLVAEAAAAGDIRDDVPLSIFRQLLIGSMMWIPEWYRDKGTKSLDEIADTIVTIFLKKPSAPKTARAVTRRARTTQPRRQSRSRTDV